MAFRGSPTTRPSKNQFIAGVGSHAYVNWAPPAARSPVPMVDGSGAQVSNDLADGEEVEILSWRPRSRDGLAYQIRRLSDGSEWWVAATYLRRRAVPEAAASGSVEVTEKGEKR